MFLRTVALTTVIAFLFSPMRGLAVDHLVSPEELALRLAAAERQRQGDIGTLKELFQQDAAQAALADAHLTPEQIQRAISRLGNNILDNSTGAGVPFQ